MSADLIATLVVLLIMALTFGPIVALAIVLWKGRVK